MPSGGVHCRIGSSEIADLAERPDDYVHIWEGGYKRSIEGAYFAQAIAEARLKHRIGVVAADPLMTLRAFAEFTAA